MEPWRWLVNGLTEQLLRHTLSHTASAVAASGTKGLDYLASWASFTAGILAFFFPVALFESTRDSSFAFFFYRAVSRLGDEIDVSVL